MKKITTLIFMIMITLFTMIFVSAESIETDRMTKEVLSVSEDLAVEEQVGCYSTDGDNAYERGISVMNYSTRLEHCSNYNKMEEITCGLDEDNKEIYVGTIVECPNGCGAGQCLLDNQKGTDFRFNSTNLSIGFAGKSISILEYNCSSRDDVYVKINIDGINYEYDTFEEEEYHSMYLNHKITDEITMSFNQCPGDDHDGLMFILYTNTSYVEPQAEVVFLIDKKASTDIILDAIDISTYLEQEGYEIGDKKVIDYDTADFQSTSDRIVYVVMDDNYVMTVIPEDSEFAKDVSYEVSDFIDDELGYDEDTVDFEFAEEYDSIREMLDDNKDDVPEVIQRHWVYASPNEYTQKVDVYGNTETLEIKGVTRGQEVEVILSIGSFPMFYNETLGSEVEFDNGKLDYSCSNGVGLNKEKTDIFTHDWHGKGDATKVIMYFDVDSYFDFAECDLNVELVYQNERYPFELGLEFDGTEPAFVITDKELSKGWNLITLSDIIEYDNIEEDKIKAAYIYDSEEEEYYDVFDNNNNEKFEEIYEKQGVVVLWVYMSEDTELKTTINTKDLQELAESYNDKLKLNFFQGWNYFALMPHMSKQYDNGFLDIGYDSGAVNEENSIYFWDADDREWTVKDLQEVILDNDILDDVSLILYPYLTYYNFDYTAEFQDWSAVPEFPDIPISDMPISDIPKIELFVLSYDPYGPQMEKAILPSLELLGSEVDFTLKFVRFIFNGKDEVDEELRQYCIQKEEKPKLLPYLRCFLEDGNSTECMSLTNIDVDKMEECLEDTEEKFGVKENYFDTVSASGRGDFNIYEFDNDKYDVISSPTLIIDGKQQEATRSAQDVFDLICSSFINKPSVCNTKLSSEIEKIGFGW